MSNSGDLLKSFGPTAAFKFSKYAEERINELYKQFETACDMDEVSRIKGAITEVRKIQKTFEVFSKE